MGFGGISPGSLVLILLICVLLFGTKKLSGIGKDLGDALKGFREGLNNDSDTKVKSETKTEEK